MLRRVLKRHKKNPTREKKAKSKMWLNQWIHVVKVLTRITFMLAGLSIYWFWIIEMDPLCFGKTCEWKCSFQILTCTVWIICLWQKAKASEWGSHTTRTAHKLVITGGKSPVNVFSTLSNACKTVTTNQEDVFCHLWTMNANAKNELFYFTHFALNPALVYASIYFFLVFFKFPSSRPNKWDFASCIKIRFNDITQCIMCIRVIGEPGIKARRKVQWLVQKYFFLINRDGYSVPGMEPYVRLRRRRMISFLKGIN